MPQQLITVLSFCALSLLSPSIILGAQEAALPSEIPPPAPISAPIDQPLNIAFGLNLYTTVEAITANGIAFDLPIEVGLDKAFSAGINLGIHNLTPNNLEYGFFETALWLRFYLLNQGFTEPAQALGGLFFQGGVDLEFWWGQWPGQLSFDYFNIGARFALGYKFIIADTAATGLKRQGLYIEPALGYALRSNWGGRFAGGLSIGWVF